MREHAARDEVERAPAGPSRSPGALARVRAWLPGSALRWVLALGALVAWGVILATIAITLRPMFADASLIGQHDWDQMESHRELVVKTLREFHQFPFWQPYACGGHPNWGGFESGTTIVSPWLPAYLAMTLPHAMRAEIVGSALLSALGAWLLAGRFTSSPAARALVVVGFAVNGRWALQIDSGHTWHLAYLWTPWTLYFYDRAVGLDADRGVSRLRDVFLAGACIAMMVYTGGIYPLPETAFVVALYGLFLALAARSFRPLAVGVGCALAGLGLAAPKLLPVLEMMLAHPRLVDSTETIDLSGLVAVLTSPDQSLMSMHEGISQWGWHEWGMYVGWAVVAAAFVGTALSRGARESALKWAGLVSFALGLGAFHPDAPWSLLHEVPVFRSQHVPSRWMYPAILLLLVVTAATLERGLRRTGALRGTLEAAALVAVAWIGWDVSHVTRTAIEEMFATPMPLIAALPGPFHSEAHIPLGLAYQNEWAPASLTPILAGVGTIDCGTFPAFHNYYRDQAGHVPGLGAHGAGDPAYRGEAFVAEGRGRAQLVRFTPNEMEVLVSGARPGDHLVLNQNYDPGWRADGKRALDWADAVATELHAGDQTVVFRYRPALLWEGLALFAITLGAFAFAASRRRRYRRNLGRYTVATTIASSAPPTNPPTWAP